MFKKFEKLSSLVTASSLVKRILIRRNIRLKDIVDGYFHKYRDKIKPAINLFYRWKYVRAAVERTCGVGHSAHLFGNKHGFASVKGKSRLTS